MSLKNLLLSALCASATLPAFATTWEIVSFDSESVWFLDIDRLSEHKGVVKSRLFVLDIRPETEAQPGQIVQAEFNCQSKRFRLTETRHIAADGTGWDEKLSPEWATVNPATTSETLMAAACKKGPRQDNLVRDNGNIVRMMQEGRAKFPAIIRRYIHP